MSFIVPIPLGRDLPAPAPWEGPTLTLSDVGWSTDHFLKAAQAYEGNSRWEIDPTTLISAAKLMVETCLKSITHSNPEIMQSPELQAIMAGFEASLEQIKSQLVTQMNQNHSNLTNRVNLHHAQASNNYANTTRQITTIQTQVQEMNACIQRIDRLL
ncbi:hypothetical protein MJO28_006169 [Puccinia striiformis f. sp. tritici]|uniref:Uncharacterized protein n=2 Tax=Puccinia striiformis f. sp. tritici TaxID=168172 RepID=A0A0L0UYN4_9BASI|nr:hypothetical protein Pst134EB_012357 [Puccinia striiformis f. sp. tritici]KAI7953622.1 hypothetical protein MJO28_006169 [Puccinia striiformis f. sp. tritici]KAI7957959.1 hypothetical protein MJO29_006176 [Puccinia striiformis f. sp. tritici]KAI9609110.1 hypothetical protein KEM48_003030 [Puccinia striiformis f. sp. tritici PST-130]KNE91864.1 hypothetical protein PSTG_14718 [Puccinia striiformis f. sp. tritici PST-78]